MANTSVIIDKKKNEDQNLVLGFKVNIDTINTIQTIFTLGQEVTVNSKTFKVGSPTGEWRVCGISLQTAAQGRVRLYSGSNVIFNKVLTELEEQLNYDSLLTSVNSGENLRLDSAALIVDAFIWVEFTSTSPTPWILTDGVWDDLGVWNDNALWNDGQV